MSCIKQRLRLSSVILTIDKQQLRIMFTQKKIVERMKSTTSASRVVRLHAECSFEFTANHCVGGCVCVKRVTDVTHMATLLDVTPTRNGPHALRVRKSAIKQLMTVQFVILAVSATKDTHATETTRAFVLRTVCRNNG
ncbi:hypothetical protein NECAME_12653 [Necator americanus]|uniref:Uncharacterized protein n=1 Tax=Necator americanus TaxID=51031 RepID=W2SYY5_NECAM|nr:hypothetical protein NECAME_12653 [Necator americanus]ETN74905.1 hypothetical protein NECAME_12653 [Necator americanus]